MLELEDTRAEVLKTDLSSLFFSHTPLSEAKHEARALKEKRGKGKPKTLSPAFLVCSSSAWDGSEGGWNNCLSTRRMPFDDLFKAARQKADLG